MTFRVLECKSADQLIGRRVRWVIGSVDVAVAVIIDSKLDEDDGTLMVQSRVLYCYTTRREVAPRRDLDGQVIGFMDLAGGTLLE